MQKTCIESCFCSQHSVFGSSDVTVGISGLFVYLVHCIQFFAAPYSFFVFCWWRRCLSSVKYYSKGSQIPAWLRKSEDKSRVLE